MQAVRGEPVPGAGRELPPELGAFGVAGEMEQAGEDEGAVDVVDGRRHGAFVGELGDVEGGAGAVEDPAGHHRQALADGGEAFHVRCRGRLGARRVGGQAAQGGADVEFACGGDRHGGVGQKVVDGGAHRSVPFRFLVLPGPVDRPRAPMFFIWARRRSRPLRPW